MSHPDGPIGAINQAPPQLDGRQGPSSTYQKPQLLLIGTAVELLRGFGGGNKDFLGRKKIIRPR